MDELVVDVRVALSHLFGYMGNVELDRPAATGLEVDEQRAVVRVEDVSGVRLAVHELLSGSALANRPRGGAQRVQQKMSVGVIELGSPVAVRDELLRFLDPVGEMRSRDIEALHANVKARERGSVVGRWQLTRSPVLVVRPQRDREVITLVDAGRYTRIKSRHGAVRFGEAFRDVDFELCRAVGGGRNTGKNIAWQQPDCEPVRRVKNDRLVDRQSKRRDDRRGGSHRARYICDGCIPHGDQ